MTQFVADGVGGKLLTKPLRERGKGEAEESRVIKLSRFQVFKKVREVTASSFAWLWRTGIRNGTARSNEAYRSYNFGGFGDGHAKQIAPIVPHKIIGI